MSRWVKATIEEIAINTRTHPRYKDCPPDYLRCEYMRDSSRCHKSDGHMFDHAPSENEPGARE